MKLVSKKLLILILSLVGILIILVLLQLILNSGTFRVVSTTPANGQTGVYAGEQTIAFTTNKALTASSQFKLTINPSLPYYWRFINSYPTKQVRAQVYGDLTPNTKYQLTVSDSQGRIVYSWNFTTSSKPGQSSSALVSDQERNIIQQYFPLFDYVPYSTDDFSIDYTSTPNTLAVKAKNPDVNEVKQEINAWIKSHGVDPSTQTIKYE